MLHSFKVGYLCIASKIRDSAKIRIYCFQIFCVKICRLFLGMWHSREWLQLFLVVLSIPYFWYYHFRMTLKMLIFQSKTKMFFLIYNIGKLLPDWRTDLYTLRFFMVTKKIWNFVELLISAHRIIVSKIRRPYTSQSTQIHFN